MIQLKNRPFAGKVFSDVGGVTSCAVLVRFPTLTILLVEEESELVEAHFRTMYEAFEWYTQ